jgi:hypothetical protein
MRWHTDRPIPALRRTPAIQPLKPFDLHRISAPARVAYTKARAYFRKKIRAKIRAQTSNRDDESR